MIEKIHELEFSGECSCCGGSSFSTDYETFDGFDWEVTTCDSCGHQFLIVI